MSTARPAYGATLAAFVAVVLTIAGSNQSCPWDYCDEDEATYMHLLQVHADSHRGEAVSGKKDEVGALKRLHPYYHTSSEIHDKINLLSKGCGGALKMQTITDDYTDIDVVHVKASNATPVNRVFILFGEHSRELISPESGLRLLQLICEQAEAAGGQSVPSMLQDNEFQLVLNGNPQSRMSVEEGEYCLRTNPNGVDLNRNWDEKWSADSELDQTNAGPRPFSEPETRIFKKLAEEFKPTTFLTVHSGTRGMYMPFAYDREHTAKFNAPLMLQVLKNLDKTHCQCPFGAAGKEVGYPCPGTCLDWVYEKLRTPYVFAFEIWAQPDDDVELKQRWDQKMQNGGLKLLQSGSHLGHEHFAELFNEFRSDFVQRRVKKAEAQDDRDACFRMFNPDTEKYYNATVQNWASAYLDMASMVAQDLKKDKTAAAHVQH